MTHGQLSPLLLCDACPRSYHMACLGQGWRDLEEGDWCCPKCADSTQVGVRGLESRGGDKVVGAAGGGGGMRLWAKHQPPAIGRQQSVLRSPRPPTLQAAMKRLVDQESRRKDAAERAAFRDRVRGSGGGTGV